MQRCRPQHLLLTLTRQITISQGRSRKSSGLVMGSKTIKRNQTHTPPDIRENAKAELIGGEAKRAPVRLEINCATQPLDPRSVGYSQRPYEHHFGVTFLGIEYWGFNLAGLKPAPQNVDRERALTVRVAQACPPSRGTAPNGAAGNRTGSLRVSVEKI